MLVDNVKVRNLLDVPNCDGIDPDHSRNVEIRNCNIACGDDGVVIKCSRQPIDYGEAANIHVHDCVIETQDAGLKIGTETTSDIHDIRFERCHIKTSSRGLCIQLRDDGNIYDIDLPRHHLYLALLWRSVVGPRRGHLVHRDPAHPDEQSRLRCTTSMCRM